MLLGMKEQSSSRSSVVTILDPKTAAVLTDPATLDQLEPFIGRASSISEAAQQTGSNPNTLYHWVKRWETLGLVEVSEETPRNGRAIKRYQAVADTFFVPFNVSPFPTLEDILATLDKQWELRLRKQVVKARQKVTETWGYTIRCNSEGALQVASAKNGEEVNFLEADAPAVLSCWCDSLYLTEEEAKDLQRQLHKLLEPRERASERKRYMLRVGIAPLE